MNNVTITEKLALLHLLHFRNYIKNNRIFICMNIDIENFGHLFYNIKYMDFLLAYLCKEILFCYALTIPVMPAAGSNFQQEICTFGVIFLNAIYHFLNGLIKWKYISLIQCEFALNII